MQRRKLYMPYYTVMIHIILHGLPVKGDGVGRRCGFLIGEEELRTHLVVLFDHGDDKTLVLYATNQRGVVGYESMCNELIPTKIEMRLPGCRR